MSAGIRSGAGAEWRNGWPLVFCATIGVGVAGIHYPVMGAMLRPLTEAYGWSRGEAALGLTIYSLIGPFANVIAGATADRLGPRRVVLAGAVLFGIAYSLFAFAGPALWQWYAASALFAILGHFIGPVVWTMAVVRHFSASRGLALALTLSGSGAVASLMPGIVFALMEWGGLRGTFLALAAGAALLAFVPALLLFHEPGQVGRPSQALRDTTVSLPGLSVAHTLSCTQFWRLGLALLLVALTVGTFIVHFQSMLADAGLTRAQAATAALIIGPMMVTGRVGTGLLFDRFAAPAVAGCAFGVLTVACCLMLAFDGSITWALLTAGVIGLGVGAEVDVVAFLTSRYFGLRRYGVTFAILIGVYGVGVGSGSALAGRVFDQVESYDLLLMALGLGCLIAGALAATLGKPDDRAGHSAEV